MQKVSNINLATFLFFLGYLSQTLHTYFAVIPGVENFINFATIVSIIALVFSGILKLNKYTARSIIILSFTSIVGAITYISCGDNSILKFSALLFAVNTISLDSCIRFDIIVRAISIVSVVILSQIGIVPDIVMSSAYGERHSLGFTNPNTLAAACLVLFLEILYINRFNIKLINWAILLLMGLALDYVTRSRSTFYILCFTLFLTIKFDKFIDLYSSNIYKFFAINSFLIFSLVSFFLTFLLSIGNEYAHYVDAILTGRLTGILDLYEELGINVLASNIYLEKSADNIYGYLLLYLGSFVFMIAMISFVSLQRILFNNRNYELSFIFVVFSVYGITERLWFYPDVNIFMLATALLIYRNFRIK